MILSGCRVVCMGRRGLQDTVRYMATTLGAKTYDVIDYSCTHLIGTSLNDDTVAFTQSFYPWVRIVHVRWIARCWARGVRASEREYDLAFYLQAQRTGTFTRLGCCNVFNVELRRFDAAQALLAPTPLVPMLTGSGAARCHVQWPLVCRILGGTVFWGYLVRDCNWQARRAVVLALARHARDPVRKRRKRPRCASDGPAHVLLRVAGLPCVLKRAVVEYL